MPERTCIGCLSVREKSSLLRVVSSGGLVTADVKGRMQGRGAYICPVEECIRAAWKKKGAFARALRTNAVTTDIEVFLSAFQKVFLKTVK